MQCDHVSPVLKAVYVKLQLLMCGEKNIIFSDREVPFGQTLCSTQSTWCTVSNAEKEKCDVIRAAGISTGVYPLIECRDAAGTTVACLNDVSIGRADFTGIDSNFGFIAR